MHITIKDKKECSGCSACASICPRQCITMQTDKFDLSYPKVDESKCIECGLCIKTCPFINIYIPTDPQYCYSVFNKDVKLRMQSSSGGVFIALAENILSHQGIVFGAAFDNSFKVVHREAKSIEEVRLFMGSKYVQSEIFGNYTKAKDYLERGRQVLFSGTPCQIAGLNHYLQKSYANLLTVEVICHGVPAPYVWTKYINAVCESLGSNNRIKNINFRDKRNGWRKFGLSIGTNEKVSISDNQKDYYESFSKDPYMQAFLKNLSLRPSCYSCKAKSGRSNADLTLGDFWGIENFELSNDDKGISCVIVRTEKGKRAIENIGELEFSDCKYSQILSGNPCLEHSVYKTDSSVRFKKAIIKYSLPKAIDISLNPSLWRRIHYAIYRRLNIFGNRLKS